MCGSYCSQQLVTMRYAAVSASELQLGILNHDSPLSLLHSHHSHSPLETRRPLLAFGQQQQGMDSDSDSEWFDSNF